MEIDSRDINGQNLKKKKNPNLKNPKFVFKF